MASTPNPPSEDFAGAANDWDLERLYEKLARAKKEWASHTRAGLTPTEKLHLRGLLCGCSPAEIAEKLPKDRRGLEANLSRGLYRYVEILTGREPNTLSNWRDVIDWLDAAGYRTGPSARRGQDWDGAPDASVFYGRTGELGNLEQWIVRERCRLVAIWGMGGIGKTALAARMAQQTKDKFEYIVWQSLRHAPPLNELLANLIQFLANRQETDWPATVAGRVSRLMEYLRTHRCLVVLDEWQSVLRPGQPAGHYLDGYEEYGELLRQVGESSHQSCLLLASWEKPKEIAVLESPNLSVRSFPLKGLGEAAKEILREKGLSEQERWEELIRAYGGNPLALKMVAATIQDVFAGSVSEFLNKSLYLGDFEYLLYQHFKRLSEFEKEIVGRLANRQPLSISQLREDMQLEGATELLKALESLVRRSLIEKVKESSEMLYTVQPVVVKYVSNQSSRR
ncbi:NB-ARC domain-containing protein [Kamptonema formosum]|uniref:NB-ARC domain-containing protein n=1 Tax=Kamptonema formosum TaxID=331992 RepID=UPI00034C5850|nr:NB-ARC domain-containing protein [Oscillatoria sp. PCC 10802]